MYVSRIYDLKSWYVSMFLYRIASIATIYRRPEIIAVHR